MSGQDAPVESNVELSSEPISTEIGSGNVESEAVYESGNGNEISGQQAADIDQAAQDIEEAIEDGASDQEVQELIETFHLKVNGREKAVTLDWNNKDDIVRRLQMAEAGQEAMQYASERDHQIETALNAWQNNPEEFLAELGIDPDEWAERRLESKIRELQKSPEQIAQEEREQELEALRERVREQEEAQRDFEFQQLQQQHEVDLDRQITDALSATTELPKTPYVVKRVADAMLDAMRMGRTDIEVQDVIPSVVNGINSELQELFDAMPDKVLEQYLGNKTIDRLRKQRLSKMQPRGLSGIKDSGKAPKEQTMRERKQSIRDFLKNGIS